MMASKHPISENSQGVVCKRQSFMWACGKEKGKGGERISYAKKNKKGKAKRRGKRYQDVAESPFPSAFERGGRVGIHNTFGKLEIHFLFAAVCFCGVPWREKCGSLSFTRLRTFRFLLLLKELIPFWPGQ